MITFCSFGICLELFHTTAQLHINLGLDKLRETQAGVEDMQKGLAEKERRLRCGASGKSIKFGNCLINQRMRLHRQLRRIFRPLIYLRQIVEIYDNI